MNLMRSSAELTSTCLLLAIVATSQALGSPPSEAPSLKSLGALVTDFCLDCHSGPEATSNLDLELLAQDLKGSIASPQNGVWEKVAKRLRARQMPPADYGQPEDELYRKAIFELETALDAHAAEHPRPGRTEAIRRLNRTEYQNAVRDLLGIQLDVKELLPADQEGHGFDNVTVGELPPILLSRYLSAAEKISRLAVGRVRENPDGRTVRLPAARTQEAHVAGLPLGTRGGLLLDHHFPTSGNYEIQIRLMRDRDEKVEGLNEPHELDVLVDRKLAHRFEINPPEKKAGWALDYTLSDKHLVKRIQVKAGLHQVGVTFPAKQYSLLDNRRQPFDVAFNRHRHPRRSPAVYEVSIVGPFEPQSNESMTNTLSRKILFEGLIRDEQREELRDPKFARMVAERVLRRVLRLAYRRPVEAEDLQVPMSFFELRFQDAGFEAGIETALTTILINPHFLFRVEKERAEIASQNAFPISDLELASRLAFFLWSSLPDDRLLALAESNELSRPEVIESQVSRMLQDPKAESLVTNFAAQWLYLRNLDSLQPDKREFADFDDNLREAMRQETELLFGHMLKHDESILYLLKPDVTYLNERLAKHYGLQRVAGSQFRPVPVANAPRRGGILRHASILSVTSYATRTSPTIRGNWVLENLLGTPAPPPPPNVPALKEKTASVATSVRQRLAEHRANPACASCHNLMDPIGFALENYDAVGRWRHFEGEQDIDSSGQLPNGMSIQTVEDLENGILENPELFAFTFAGKLLTFALGRGVEPYDGPALRGVVSKAKQKEFRFSEVVKAIALSQPFRMKSAIGIAESTKVTSRDP